MPRKFSFSLGSDFRGNGTAGSTCLELHCSACCYNMVHDISGAEAGLLVELAEHRGIQVVITAGSKRLRNVMERHPGALHFHLRSLPRNRRGRPRAPTLEDLNGNRLVEWHIDGACPFLNQDGTCSIHDLPEYPSSCRNFVPDPNNPNSECARKRKEEGFDKH